MIKKRKAWNKGKFVTSSNKRCLVCNCLFLSVKKSGNRGFTKFCSNRCANIFQNKGKEIFFNCKTCNKKVRTTIHVKNKYNKKYCSRECAGSWKGGITPINHLIRTSREYKLWRTAVFQRDKYTCVWCGIKGGNGETVVLNADHIKPFYLYPELRFAIDNGRTLCIDCHKTTDTYGRPRP